MKKLFFLFPLLFLIACGTRQTPFAAGQFLAKVRGLEVSFYTPETSNFTAIRVGEPIELRMGDENVTIQLAPDGEYRFSSETPGSVVGLVRLRRFDKFVRFGLQNFSQQDLEIPEGMGIKFLYKGAAVFIKLHKEALVLASAD